MGHKVVDIKYNCRFCFSTEYIVEKNKIILEKQNYKFN